jgi:hypothetical protein
LNSRPADYESAALPLSYLGKTLWILAIYNSKGPGFVHSMPNIPDHRRISPNNSAVTSSHRLFFCVRHAFRTEPSSTFFIAFSVLSDFTTM